MRSAQTSYYWDTMFIEDSAANENGIITNFHHLHERENNWAIGVDHHKLRQEIHEALGYKGDRWIEMPLEKAEEADDMYMSARAGQAQLHYDEIINRRRADNGRYY
jgi:hypothetical protein